MKKIRENQRINVWRDQKIIRRKIEVNWRDWKVKRKSEKWTNIRIVENWFIERNREKSKIKERNAEMVGVGQII